MLGGRVEHRDSLGNAGLIGAGDVQWMTAGSGILDEEMPKVGPRRVDGFQVWGNLPAKLKMTAPRYQDLPAAQLPEIVRPDGARIRIIAGKIEGKTGAVRDVFADPTYLDVALPAGGLFEQPVPRDRPALLYVFQGEVAVGGDDDAGSGRLVPAIRLAMLEDGEVLGARASETPARFLLLSALPLNEPAVRYGPFVMNTREEVAQALRKLRDGTFIKISAWPRIRRRPQARFRLSRQLGRNPGHPARRGGQREPRSRGTRCFASRS